VFTALLLIENPELASSGFIELMPPGGLFSFNMRNVRIIYYNSYSDDDGQYQPVGDFITLTVTLNGMLNPTDNITTYRYNFSSTIDGVQGIIGYSLPNVIIYESSKYSLYSSCACVLNYIA